MHPQVDSASSSLARRMGLIAHRLGPRPDHGCHRSADRSVHAAAVSVRSAESAQADRQRIRRRSGRPVHRYALRSAARCGDRGACHKRRRAWLSAEYGHPCVSYGVQQLDAAAPRRRGSDRPDRSCRRLQRVRRVAAGLHETAPPRTRHGAVSSHLVSVVRDGCHAWSVPLSVGAVRPRWSARPRRSRPGRHRASAPFVGQQPGQPDRSSRRSQSRSNLGAFQRDPRVLGRVLHRVHLGRTASYDSRTWARRRRCRALVVEALEPGRSPSWLLCRRCRDRRLLEERPPARWLARSRSGAGSGCGRL